MATLKLMTGEVETYVFDPTPKVVVSSERVAVGDGDMQGIRRTWTITGRLHGNDIQLVAFRDALEAAFAFTDDLTKSLVLRNNDDTGDLDTLSDATYKGLRVVQPVGYPEGAGVQFATLRDYTLTCQATTLLDGTAWGGYTRSTVLGMDGQSHITISGEYTGPGAQLAADAAKLWEVGGEEEEPSYRIISEQQVVDADQQKVSFSYQYVDLLASREVISLVETITVQRAGQDFVYQTVLGGDPPIRQDTVLRPCRVTQSGQAVGLSGYPDFPDYAYSPDYLRPESDTAKGSPKLAADGTLTEYPIRWNYVYEFPTAQALTDPVVPPA